MAIEVPDASDASFDIVALGEVMLRLDPGETRITTARRFEAWEGGGEYNVARGLRRCFGMRAALVTALVDNPVGRLIEALMAQSGIDLCYVRWEPFDGLGRKARNGLNFTERGFGPRAAVGCSDRGHTPISQLRPGMIDWEEIFGNKRARWFHCGGIFTALGEHTSEVAAEAMSTARRHGAIVSYDLNYRSSLWNEFGGQTRAQEVNRALASSVDVMLGNEEDFSAALGFSVEDAGVDFSELDANRYGQMMERICAEYPQLKVVASSLRVVKSASRNDWGAVCFSDGRVFEATWRRDLEILDRVGGGDSFASGLIFGLLSNFDVETALQYGVAHGALAMSTPGDVSMATREEVAALVMGSGARARR